jgi:hypothetical protein
MKWFKHYSDALDDPFVQELMDEFSHLGYVVWFGLIEIISKENGSNVTGKLTISPEYLRRKLRTSPTKLRQVLDFCRTDGRLLVNYSEKKWEIDFPKIMEIKDNYMKDLQASCKKPSNHKEEDKDIRERTKDKDKEKDNTLRKAATKTAAKPEQKSEQPILKINDFLAKYCESFKALYGKNPVITGKDSGIAARIVRVPEILTIMEQFFTSKDKFITDNCHSLSIIESQINKLIAGPNKKSGIESWLQKKEAENVTR